MDRPDIDAIEARCNAATPGPWVFSEGERESAQNRQSYFVSVSEDEMLVADYRNLNLPIAHVSWWDKGKVESHANAEFIAHARTDVLTLIACIRNLEIEISKQNDFITVMSKHSTGLETEIARLENIIEEATRGGW